METLMSLDITSIIALVTSITTIVAAILGIIEKFKAGNYKAALDDSKTVSHDLMHTIDEFKELVGPVVRQPILKNLGTKLDVSGLKEQVDETLTQLGLNNKS